MTAQRRSKMDSGVLATQIACEYDRLLDPMTRRSLTNAVVRGDATTGQIERLQEDEALRERLAAESRIDADLARVGSRLRSKSVPGPKSTGRPPKPEVYVARSSWKTEGFVGAFVRRVEWGLAVVGALAVVGVIANEFLF